MRLFISYNFKTANIARGLAERLMSHGHEVWFAEYRVMLSEFFGDDERIRNAIRSGIETATHAILLTNRAWADSDWFQFEIKTILAHFKSPEHLIEVRIPQSGAPAEHFLSKTGTTIEFKGDPEEPCTAELDTLAVEIGECLGLQMAFDRRPRAHNKVVLPHYGVSFDAGPLRAAGVEYRDPSFTLEEAVSVLNLLRFEGDVRGTRVAMHLFADPFRAAIGGTPDSEISTSLDSDVADRTICDAYRRYAKEYFSESGHHKRTFGEAYVGEKGLHVVFVDRHSQVGFTLKYRHEGKTRWERRYVISLSPRDEGRRRKWRKGEAQLNFMVKATGDEREKFEHFCRLTPVFDSIAQTFRYTPPRGRQARANSLPILVSTGAYAAIAGSVLAYVLAAGKPTWLLGGVSVLAGLLAVDLLHFVLRPSYREYRWTMVPLSHEPTTGDLGFASALGYHLKHCLHDVVGEALVYVMRGRGCALFWSIIIAIIAARLLNLDDYIGGVTPAVTAATCALCGAVIKAFQIAYSLAIRRAK